MRVCVYVAKRTHSPPFRTQLSVDEGAATSIYCALEPGALNGRGRYFDKCVPVPPVGASGDGAIAARIVSETDTLLRQKGYLQ